MVIVVMAILASLPYIGYTNVGNRANDSAVKSDLANFAKQLQLHYAGSGSFPRGGATISSSGATLAGSVVTSPGISLKIAHKSYHEQLEIHSANFIYGSGPALICGSAAFNIFAESRSRKKYLYKSSAGFESRRLCYDGLRCLPRHWLSEIVFVWLFH